MKSESRKLKLLVSIIIMFTVSYLLSLLLVDVIKNNNDFFHNILFPIEFDLPESLNQIGSLIIFLGIALGFFAKFGLLFVAKIDFLSKKPHAKPSTLSISGPYKYTRNPIYITVLMFFSGLGLHFESVTALVVVLLLFLIFNFWLKQYEESELVEAFGSECLEYKNLVKKWI